MMNPRALHLRHGGIRHWAAPWVLAVLCLRALVPAGFMLAPVDGGLDVVLCDADAAAALHSFGVQHAMHGHVMAGDGAAHHHDAAGHPEYAGHSGHHHSHPDPTCPYAQSAGPAPLPALPALPPLQASATRLLPVDFSQTHSQFGPSREQSPRGPPTLA
ncbi:MAG TPA: hypothetical protein VMT29_06550 [Steroidobacteraceae bacterium]|nr:hypothetical protein [Steroidobacteraceae bacterium]